MTSVEKISSSVNFQVVSLGGTFCGKAKGMTKAKCATKSYHRVAYFTELILKLSNASVKMEL